MKAVCLTSWLSRRAGGLFESVRRLSQTLQSEQRVLTEVIGLRDDYADEDLPKWDPLRVTAFPVRAFRQFGFAPGLAGQLYSSDADIAQVHGLWMYPSVAMVKWHKRKQVPYIVSPHGMLDTWAVRNSRWKKRLAFSLYENAHLQNAGAIRALCEPEACSIRAFGVRRPICVIPNGVDLPINVVPLPPWATRVAGRKVLLYLGRIHPKKGLPALLEAWRAAGTVPGAADWALVIAGWDQGGHEQELKDLTQSLGLCGSVCFVGPQFGAFREASYGHCDAFVLPSLSEGLPMAVLEAWANSKPVLITEPCNLPEGFARCAAIKIDPRPESITEGLRTLFSLSVEERTTMGERGLRLVTARFTWSRVAAEVRSVYNWILGGGPMPSCVHFE